MTGKLYTRIGDDGFTYCYFLGRRIPKDDPVIEFIGTLDEANSHLGLARSLLPKELGDYEELYDVILYIQRLLFNIGFSPSNKEVLTEKGLEEIEELIDRFFGDKPLKNFILPGGHPSSSELHIARSVIRRAERTLVPLVRHGIYPEIALKTLNRLGDLLFALPVYINRKLGIKEESL